MVLEPLVRSISEFVLVSKGQVAIKLEPIKASVPMLELESNVYANVPRGGAGVPVMPKVEQVSLQSFYVKHLSPLIF